MSYFPIYMDMSQTICLIVGGGHVALQKAQGLIGYVAQMIVVAPKIHPMLYQLERKIDDRNQFIIYQRTFQEEDMIKADVIIAATDDRDSNTQISLLCRQHRKLVNVVDVPQESDFIFPAIWRNKDLMISVSTGGKSPMFAAILKEELDMLIPHYYSDLVEMLGEYRDTIKKATPDKIMRKQIYQSLIHRGKELQRQLTSNEIEDIIKNVIFYNNEGVKSYN